MRVRSLEQTIEGRVLLPSSPDYDAARRSFVARFDWVAPQAIVQCARPEDVAAAIAVARADGLPVAIRSGGHCYAGRSSTTGLLVDVSPMRSVSVTGQRATIGAGTRLGDVYAELRRHDLTFPGGSCPTVGIAGLTLGGGFGILGRTTGLACDHLVAAQVVLADGRVVTCDDDHHAELFWALRGAGGLGFGVVTSLEVRVVPAAPATNFRVAFATADATDVLDAWQRWAPTAPDAMAASLLLKDTGERGSHPTLEVVGAMLGSESATDGLLSELAAMSGREPTSVFRQHMSERDTRAFWAGLDDAGVERHGLRFHKSEYFRHVLPRDAAGALVAHFEQTASVGRYRELDFSPWGGAYNRKPPDATAFAHRDHLFLLKHTAEVEPGSPPDAVTAAHRWVTRSWETVHPHAAGAVYPNFPDPDLDDWDVRYHGANVDALKRIKATYDPQGVFRGGRSPG
jgi:FAD/FMN-containing dehydrogenase